MAPEIATIVDWIRSRHPDLAAVDPEVDLIENRIIDSLAFAEFIILVERLAGRAVDVDAMDVDDFRTLARLDRAFFARG